LPQGRAVQVDPMKPKLKPPGTRRLKVKCQIMISTFAFKFKLRRYMKELAWACKHDKPVIPCVPSDLKGFIGEFGGGPPRDGAAPTVAAAPGRSRRIMPATSYITAGKAGTAGTAGSADIHLICQLSCLECQPPTCDVQNGMGPRPGLPSRHPLHQR
jgi:hypothetical protein